MNKKILGIIPARGGSKGVKRKNIRNVGGMPLIYWSFKASMNSKLLEDCFLSTEDEEFLSIAEKYSFPYIKRPCSLAKDNTPMVPVLQHLCKEAEKINGRYDLIILLQPTAPMRTGKNIDDAINLMIKNNDRDSLISVYQVEDCHPSRMYTINNGILDKFYNEPDGSLRQNLEQIFHRNGAIYICTRELLMDHNKLICDSPLPFIMKKTDSINIDDEQDLLVADLLMQHKHNKINESDHD